MGSSDTTHSRSEADTSSSLAHRRQQTNARVRTHTPTLARTHTQAGASTTPNSRTCVRGSHGEMRQRDAEQQQ